MYRLQLLVGILALFSLPALGGDANPPTPKEALAWFHGLPKMGGGVNKGLDVERFKKFSLEDLKTVKEVLLGGHPYLPNGKLGGHLKLPDSDYRFLTVLPALETLKFPENDLGDEALVHIGKIKSLKNLQLMENKFSGDGMKSLTGLTKLTHLDLRWNQTLDDSCVPHLMKMTSLEELYLFKTLVTPAGVKRIEQALPKCKVIVAKK